jgi:hypothetical protein
MTSGAKEVHSKHPFFWAGYLLVDCEPPFEATAKEVAGEEKKEEDKVAGEEGEDKPDSKTDSP